MELTKTGTGQFTGTIGRTAVLKLMARSTGAPLAMISAVYGNTVLAPNTNQVSVTLVAGVNHFTVVYATTLAGGWVDLFEVDAAGGQQKLRAGVFDPSEPTLSITLEGQ